MPSFMMQIYRPDSNHVNFTNVLNKANMTKNQIFTAMPA